MVEMLMCYMIALSKMARRTPRQAKTRNTSRSMVVHTLTMFRKGMRSLLPPQDRKKDVYVLIVHCYNDDIHFSYDLGLFALVL